MDMTENTQTTDQRPQRLVIRIGCDTLSFSTTRGTEVIYQPYSLNSSISMAANLREALRTETLLAENYSRVLVMVDVPVLMVPMQLFDEGEQEALYRHTFSGEAQLVLNTVLPALNAVAVYAIQKDLNTVLTDAFGNVRYSTAIAPVWNHLHERSYTGPRQKLYGYFHDHRMEVFSFTQNRFKFCNSYEVDTASNALYFLLAVWKVLGMDATHDELHLAGEFSESEQLLSDAQQFLKRVFFIHPSGEFNRAPITQIPHIPYDLVTLYIKGR